MNTNNNTRTSLHWAFVGALAALIGFLSVGKMQTFWDLNLTVSIIIGLAITLLCGLILYHPMELVKNIQQSCRKAFVASYQYLKEQRSKRLTQKQKEKAAQIERETGKYKWHYRRLGLYQIHILIFERVQFFVVTSIVFSWVIPVIVGCCLFTKSLAPLFPGAVLLLIVVLFSLLLSKNSESHYLRKIVAIFGINQKTRWSLKTYIDQAPGLDFNSHRVILKKLVNLGLCEGYYRMELKQPREMWKRLYQFLLENEKKKLLFYLFPCVVYRICKFIPGAVLKLIFKTIPVRAMSFICAIPSMYNFTMIFVKEFVAVLYCLLNTNARRAIFICSVVGYFAGFTAEFLGAHATAPFWCFGVGFVFGFIQNYVFKRIEHRLQAIIEKSQFASGRAVS